MRDEAPRTVEFDYRTEIVRVAYDEPYVWPPLNLRWWPRRWRVRGYRKVARAFHIRARRMRDRIHDLQTFVRMTDLGLDLRVGVFLGGVAMHLPQAPLEAIWEAYCRVNQVPVENSDGVGGVRVSFDEILRALERELGIKREEALELTAAQIEARLSELGQQKINDLKLQAGIVNGGG